MMIKNKTVDYFAVCIGDHTKENPWGIFRVVKGDKYHNIESFTKDEGWFDNPDAIAHFQDGSCDNLTEDEARAIVEKYGGTLDFK